MLQLPTTSGCEAAFSRPLSPRRLLTPEISFLWGPSSQIRAQSRPPFPPESKEGGRSRLHSPNQLPRQIKAGIGTRGAAGSDLLAQPAASCSCLPATFKRCEGASGASCPSRKVPANRYNLPPPFHVFQPTRGPSQVPRTPPQIIPPLSPVSSGGYGASPSYQPCVSDAFPPPSSHCGSGCPSLALLSHELRELQKRDQTALAPLRERREP